MNMPHIDSGKEPGRNGKTNGDTNDSKRYGKSEKYSEEKEVDETQELTQGNIAKLSEGPCTTRNDDKKEKPQFKAGDTLLQSKPFAFIIQASHR